MKGLRGQGVKGSRGGNSLKISILILLLAAFCLLLCSNCGYKLQGRESLPFHDIKIGKIENKTYEPKLEDRLQKALAEELIRNGFMISQNAGHVITGVIDGVELRALSEKLGLAIEYEVIIKGKFFLTSSEGKVIQLRNSPAFIVSFSSSGSIPSIVAAKELALESAMRSLASEIRAGITYQK